MSEHLLMGDIHLSDNPPSSCTPLYNEQIFDILQATVDIAHQRDVTSVVWAGDVFHSKIPGRTSHRTVGRCIELARAYDRPVFVVPGNHDMQHDRLDSVMATQPLGVVIASGAVKLLHGWDEYGYGLYGVPWLMRFDDAMVSDALISYRADYTDCPALVVTHAPLYPPGNELPYENYPAENWAAAMKGKGAVYYGHVHTPAGIFTAGGVTFCNPGAISRGSLHEHNLTRGINAALWDDDTGQFTLVDLPHPPADKVFRLVEITETKTAKVQIDGLLDEIGHTTVTRVVHEDIAERIRAMPAVRAEVAANCADLLEHGAAKAGAA